ncbi:MAG: acetate--CoA ligase [Nitrospira sp.]|nr:acetate--CoA ligase [Nitrospira sp.]MDH4369727.1 acetate--CoA ligase [Nitrospira sp.]MDH5347829.1 acetate--CoA ligase [Nitrospira sp.]MDH5498479.1 acetate--CoA ligase [Nitrospira sp.]MDH5725772.1 acetate--CoA ligase [Nitrospira sp.]
MSQERYPIPDEFRKHAHITEQQYCDLYRRSIDDPDGFWSEQAETFISWSGRWKKVLDWDFKQGHVRWFDGGKLNACFNCVDRHLATRGEQTAIIWEGNEPGQSRTITYRELHAQVCRLANVLTHRGIGKGDRVCLYMPMVPEAVFAMLACARIGAIHSVVFAGFSSEAFKHRVQNCGCRLVITVDGYQHGSKTIAHKEKTDQALKDSPAVTTVLVVKRLGVDIPWDSARDVWYHEAVAGSASECPVVEMDAEDPLFILYTSGSTGKPKGVVHTTGGYLLYAAISHRYAFDYHEGEVYWCTADIGWVTGHTYSVYGPLANGAITLLFEGVPNYPDYSRLWQLVDKHQVNIFYTAPTAIRSLMAQGDEPVRKTSRRSLRMLGSVGEPIDPKSWEWFHRVVGEQRCPIADTWWQTETGGLLLTPLPGAMPLKPGSVAKPFFGVVPAIVDEKGKILEGAAEGRLVITRPWPALARTIYGSHERYLKTYFSRFPGLYDTEDGARRDADGYYWITGRIDDVLNVSGHRMGTAELESAMAKHSDVTEASVVGFPHEIKGQGIYAYVVLKKDTHASDKLRTALVEQLRQEIGPIAKPDYIQWAEALPKTRSGKIMRRILRKIAANELGDLGDTSTLADPSVVESLIANRKNI